MKNLIEHLIGSNDISYTVALLIFALVGMIISLLIHSTNRKDDEKFSITKLFDGNWKRLVLNVLLILVSIRFAKEITGVQLTEFTALLLGISYDKLAELLKNKNILVGNQQK